MKRFTFERVAVAVLAGLGIWGVVLSDWAYVRPMLLLMVAGIVAAAVGKRELLRGLTALVMLCLLIAAREVVVEFRSFLIEPAGIVLGIAVIAVAIRGHIRWRSLPRWGRVFVWVCVVTAVASATAFALLQTQYALSGFVVRAVVLNSLFLAAAYVLHHAAWERNVTRCRV